MNSKVEVETPGILHCDRFTSFWISWENDVLEVGSGDLFQHSFMSTALKKETDIHVLSFGNTNSDTAWAEWEILQDEGIVISFILVNTQKNGMDTL